MPLPPDRSDWPPTSTEDPRECYRRWSAWYRGDTSELAIVYNNAIATVDPKPVPERGLLSRFRARFFWGNPEQPNALRQARLHIPLAHDIAATSANLLMGEAPELVVASDHDETPRRKDPTRSDVLKQPHPAQRRLKWAMQEAGLHAQLLEAAEVAAAYGGVYLRITWDKVVADHPIVTPILPDRAVPEWRSGYLAAVTFWRKLPALAGDKTGSTWWHLERHETRGSLTGGNPFGVIIHGLYRGEDGNLGERQQLTKHPETAVHAPATDAFGTIVTGARRLAVEYLPNMRPNLSLPGSPLGGSDYDGGVDQGLDALDEAWTSWMRDLRHGKARLIVPAAYLRNRGRGKGAIFDPEQEVYEQLEALPRADGGMDIHNVQFTIRVAEHQATCEALTAATVRAAGYSVQSFGEGGDGVEATATEVIRREKRSFATRRRKINYARPALSRLAVTWLEIYDRHFGGKLLTDPGLRVSAQFPDGVADDAETDARVLGMLHVAEAISLYQRVKRTNPDWEEWEILEEVDRIREDKKADMPVEVDEPGGKTAAGQRPGDDGGGNKPPAGSRPASGNRPPAGDG